MSIPLPPRMTMERGLSVGISRDSPDETGTFSKAPVRMACSRTRSCILPQDRSGVHDRTTEPLTLASLL